MPKYPRSSFKKVDTIISPKVAGDDLDMNGSYALRLQNIPDMAAKGAGYHIDGVNDSISVANDAAFEVTDDMSVIVDITPNDISSFQVITGAWEATGDADNRPWLIAMTNGGVPGIALNNNDIEASTTGAFTTATVVGVNYSIAFTYDKANIELFLNGNNERSIGYTTSLSDAGSVPISIGCERTGGTPQTFCNVDIRRFLLFNTALSSDEVKALSSGTPIPYKYKKASQTEQTSGTLTVGKSYRLKDWITADDFTNVGAASNADGVEFVATGTTPTIWANSSKVVRIGCVVQLEQDGIGHTQWLDNSGNELHGAASGALPINLPVDDVQRFRHIVAMTDDTTFTSVVPAGYELEKIIFVESAGNAATLDLGTTATGQDVFDQEVISASGITTVVLNKTFSMTAAQSLYLNDDGAGTWNSASLTATLIMRRVV